MQTVYHFLANKMGLKKRLNRMLIFSTPKIT